MNNDLFKMADKLRELRDEKKSQEDYLKELNAEIDQAEKALSDAMAEAECPNFTRGGKQFILTTRTI
jgi:predicted  nucleic acid-binding Zn-ribbon protein